MAAPGPEDQSEGHKTHATDPSVSAKDPEGHARHVSTDVALKVREKVPRGQGVH